MQTKAPPFTSHHFPAINTDRKFTPTTSREDVWGNAENKENEMSLSQTRPRASIVAATSDRVLEVATIFVCYLAVLVVWLITPFAWACSYRLATAKDQNPHDDDGDQIFVPIRCWPRTTSGKRIWWAALPFLGLFLIGLIATIRGIYQH